MKRIVVIIFIFALSTSVASASEFDPIMKFKDEIDVYDNSLYERDITYGDISGWWKISDKLALALLNGVIKGKTPSQTFKNAPITIQEGLIIYTPFNKNFGLSYKKFCEPPHAPYEFEIRIVPLTPENTIYYIACGRDWINPAAGCNGEVIIASTFTIVEKNKKTGLYEITGRFEESNFYRDTTIREELEKKSGVKKQPYYWAGSLMTSYDPIKYEDGVAKFVTTLHMCYPGDPCYYKIYVYWEYGPDKKLIAVKYLDKYYKEKDPHSGELRPKGEVINIKP